MKWKRLKDLVEREADDKNLSAKEIEDLEIIGFDDEYSYDFDTVEIDAQTNRIIINVVVD